MLRDNRPDIPFPNQWDVPGGGREGEESPETCALRELEEELGLRLAPDRILWRSHYDFLRDAPRRIWFLAGKITDEEITRIRLGDEGQEWRMMPITEFLSRPDAISHLKQELRTCLTDSHGATLFPTASKAVRNAV